MVAVHEDGEIAYLNTRTGRLLSSFPGQRGWISSVAQTPDGSAFVTAGVDGSLAFWAIGTSTELIRLKAHSDVASGAKFMSMNGQKRMISAGFDGFLKLWDSSGRAITASLDHGSAILHFDHTGDR
ncbi:MAG: hypothetical protein HC814_04485 [Rhodobacteraceae bacterium]|nr:hypothetical protein [Paracoccaceae bacterium]